MGGPQRRPRRRRSGFMAGEEGEEAPQRELLIPPEPGVPLSEKLMDLSKVRKTVDGTNYGYVQLDCVGKRIESIDVIESYPLLRQIDLSKNQILDIGPLRQLPHILTLN